MFLCHLKAVNGEADLAPLTARVWPVCFLWMEVLDHILLQRLASLMLFLNAFLSATFLCMSLALPIALKQSFWVTPWKKHTSKFLEFDISSCLICAGADNSALCTKKKVKSTQFGGFLQSKNIHCWKFPFCKVLLLKWLGGEVP